MPQNPRFPPEYDWSNDRHARCANGAWARCALCPSRQTGPMPCCSGASRRQANAVWQLRCLMTGATVRERGLRPGYDPRNPDMYFTGSR